MSNKQILKKAIGKAVKGGYVIRGGLYEDKEKAIDYILNNQDSPGI